MGRLRLSIYVLRNLRELTAGTVYPMSRLDVNECMPLNAQLTNIEARGIGMSVIWGTPRVMPQPCLRSFRLGQITYDDHTYAVDVDRHGDPLTWLYASDFDKVTLEKIVQDDGEHEYDPAFYNPTPWRPWLTSRLSRPTPRSSCTGPDRNTCTKWAPSTLTGPLHLGRFGV